MKTSYLYLLLCVLSGCALNPEITGYAVNTPSYFSEDKMFFVSNLPTEVSSETTTLLHTYEYNAHYDKFKERELKDKDPVSVILQGVRLPEAKDWPGGKRDIAVILDINTSASDQLLNFMAFYQRDVPPGQMLNFSNLLIYSNPSWDSSIPPYFRVRIIDVTNERNQRTRELLEQAGNLTGVISGLIPHPIIPIVGKAIEASKFILANKNNEVLMDFQVNLYGAQTQSGGAIVARLVAGQWVVVGRRSGADSSFWKNSIILNRKTDQLIQSNNPIAVPYISLAVAKNDFQVPQLVMDRSAALIKLLSDASSKSDLDTLDATTTALVTSVKSYSAERRLRKNMSISSLGELVNTLVNNAKQQDNSLRTLTKEEESRLMDLINNVIPSEARNSDINKISEWISETGYKGHLCLNQNTPLGFQWQSSECANGN